MFLFLILKAYKKVIIMNETIITSHKTWKSFFQEFFDYKDVLLFLGWRDILVQYKQTSIGILWVIIRPLLTVIIFTIIFSRIAHIPSTQAPYPLVIFSAMLVWQFFADTFTYASMSFVNNVQLISKVYFPRIMLPASRILCSLVDFSIAFLFYTALSFFRYGIVPLVNIVLLPLFMAWLAVFSFSISLLFASLIVQYRDFRHIVPFVVQLGIYITPVGFSLAMIPKNLHFIIALNPLTGIINGFRYCLLAETLYWPVIGISLAMTLLLGIISILYFKKSEETFADLI